MQLGSTDSCQVKNIVTRVQKMIKEDERMTYPSQVLDGGDVWLVFLHLLPEPDDLLHLLRVDVLGPASLHVVDASTVRLKALCVYL